MQVFGLLARWRSCGVRKQRKFAGLPWATQGGHGRTVHWPCLQLCSAVSAGFKTWICSADRRRSTDRRRSGARIDALQAMSGSRKPPRVNVPAPVVVAATDEEAANLQVFHVLSGGAPPEGSGINEVFNATNEMYAHAMARLGREPNIRPLQRSKSEGSPLLSRSVPRRPGKKRRKAEPVEDAPPSSSADLSHLRAIGASESTWHESVRRSAMESWRELQRDASCHTPFPSSTSCRFPPISRSRLTVQSEPSIRMAVFSLGRGSPSTRHATYSRPTPSRTRGELHWSPDGR